MEYSKCTLITLNVDCAVCACVSGYLIDLRGISRAALQRFQLPKEHLQ